jgi:hypothetical protein
MQLGIYKLLVTDWSFIMTFSFIIADFPIWMFQIFLTWTLGHLWLSACLDLEFTFGIAKSDSKDKTDLLCLKIPD